MLPNVLFRTAMATLKRCPKCKEIKLWATNCCIECNRFTTKLNKFLKTADEELVDDWSLCVFRDEHAAIGTDIDLVIRETTEDVRMDRLLKRFTASGHMKDIEDLIEKYKIQPEQLKSILESTYQLKCKIRGVVLFADPE